MLRHTIMNPNQADRLQRERSKLKGRISQNTYRSPDERTKDATRLREINTLLNDYYLKK
jgi:hypothetical protein